MFMLLLTACQREEELPTATTAAKEIYLKYADRSDLTVALVGGYRGFNAVMIEAPDRETWLALCEDFGVHHMADANALDTVNISSITSTLTSCYTFDSIPSIEETVDQVLKELMAHEIDGRRIDTIICVDTAISVDTVFSNHVQVLIDSVVNAALHTVSGNNQLMQTAFQHGDKGYLVASDSQRLSLCIFFYSTIEEMTQIIDHVTNINTPQ